MNENDASPVRICVLGATGRMGRSLVRAIHDSTDFELSGAAASADSAARGADAGGVAGLPTPLGVRIEGDVRAALAGAEVALEFSVAGAVLGHLEACLQAGVPLVVGTTGLDALTDERLAAAARELPVLVAPNTSLGINLLAQLVERAAASLPPDYDIEILEAHHRYKVDAPSGTALKLGAAAAAGRGIDLEQPPPPRAGHTGPRQAGSIGFAVIRGGDIVGEHTVLYAGPGERLELTHRAHDRMTFAYGALRAASWLRGRPAGLYTMADVLGFG